MSRGYMGKILNVNLSRRELEDEALDEKLCRDFIGGYGIGASLLFRRMKAGTDPLGPESILGFMTGPLTGTDAISGTRYTVVGKSPLTGGWGDANSGGSFAAYLKFSGYDGIFFTGIAEKPVYLFIDNGRAELRDAGHLWGRDSYQTDDALKKELGKDVAIACIGPAGEKLAYVSCIMHNKGSAAGRSGLGAVMGSKKIKAVAVRGKIKVPVADEQELKELRAKYLKQLGGPDWLSIYGTSHVLQESVESGDSPVKNWGGIALKDLPDATPIGWEKVDERRLKKVACYRCPVGCEAIMKGGTGEYKWAEGTYRPEYETIAMLGANCLNDNIDSIFMANDICNRYGMDTISGGAIMAFTIECYEKGLIKKKDTGGIEMKWGNHRALVAMMEKMGKREGFGDVIADGVKKAAERIGKDAGEYAIHIQGQEVPGHNPIGSYHWPATYIASTTPARHTQGSEGFSQELMPKFDKSSFNGRGLAHKIGVCNQNALMCCGMCLFVESALPSKHAMTEFLRSVTGWDITTDELLITGERIENVRQSFNIREGLNLLEFNVPGRILGRPPHKVGPLAGVTVDADTLVKEYLKEMDWDLKTARPSAKKLKELGLDDIARELAQI
jgi:aldehyde:ferredoxin oxidoreductase